MNFSNFVLTQLSHFLCPNDVYHSTPTLRRPSHIRDDTRASNNGEDDLFVSMKQYLRPVTSV